MLILLLRLHAVLSLLLVVTHASVARPRNNPPVTVPLRRRSSTNQRRTTPGDFARMAKGLRTKYNLLPSPLDRRQGSGAVPITDLSFDSSYSGALAIGSPAQTFNVILDTGSSDLWVASTACTTGCGQGTTKFNSGSSSSFNNQNQPVSITYGSGAVAGQLGTDTVSMGGFTVQAQPFVVAQEVSSSLLDTSLSGLLGMGFKSIANTESTPFVQELASGNSFSRPVMSFYLERHITDQNAAQQAAGGVLTLGDTNSSLFTGAIDFVNIPSTVTPGFWLLPVTGVTVDGSDISVGSNTSLSQLAAIDTGTTLIGGPSAVVTAIYSKIPGAQQGTGQLQGYWTFPCSEDVNLSFSFGGAHSWPINPADFKLQAQGNSGNVVCIGALFDLDPNSSTTPGSTPPRKRQSNASTTPTWIIGDTFLKNVYSVFRYDPPAVGFAQLSPSVPGAGSAPGAAVTGTGGTSTASAVVTMAVGTIPFANPSSSSSSGSSSGSNGMPRPAIGFALIFGLVGAILIVLGIV